MLLAYGTLNWLWGQRTNDHMVLMYDLRQGCVACNRKIVKYFSSH